MADVNNYHAANNGNDDDTDTHTSIEAQAGSDHEQNELPNGHEGELHAEDGGFQAYLNRKILLLKRFATSGLHRPLRFASSTPPRHQ